MKPRRFWFEATVAALAGTMSTLTILWPEWIEATTGLDPDQHSGALEWGITSALLAATAFYLARAAIAWQRRHETDAPASNLSPHRDIAPRV